MQVNISRESRNPITQTNISHMMVKIGDISFILFSLKGISCVCTLKISIPKVILRQIPAAFYSLTNRGPLRQYLWLDIQVCLHVSGSEWFCGNHPSSLKPVLDAYHHLHDQPSTANLLENIKQKYTWSID